jgi:sulfate/thiosulfate-binding protein
MRNRFQKIVWGLFTAGLLLLGNKAVAANTKILNASSDTTQRFFQDYNAAFSAYWKSKTGQTVAINQSSGDSSDEAQSVLDKVDADVVTFNESKDIDLLHDSEPLLTEGWAVKLPNKSVPYTSTIVFVVRKGNPKNIRNWDDLIRSNVRIVAANPKTSSAGRYSYLAAWGYALKKSNGDEKKARLFVQKLFANVPICSPDGPGAEESFAYWDAGDVLVTFESEAALVQEKFPKAGFEVVLPPVSIRVDNTVAVVDHFAKNHHTGSVAQAYLEYLYSDEGQELAAHHFFRPENETILQRYSTRYKPLQLLTVDEIAGGWQKAQQVHFTDGGIFDQIYRPKNLFQ